MTVSVEPAELLRPATLAGPVPARMNARLAGGRLGGWVVALALATMGLPAFATAHAGTVLVLYSNGRMLPANIEVDRGLRVALDEAVAQPTATFDEFLDSPRFDGDEHAAVFADYLRRKYAREPPDVILAAGWGALDFLIRQRMHLFPEAALLYMGVPSDFLHAIPAPPAGMRGIAMDFDFAANAALALKLHPRARRVVFVSGTSPEDRRFEAQMRQAASSIERGVTAEFLSGLPEAQVLARLRDLGPDSVVITLGYFRDGDGRIFTPREAVRAMAAVSGAPIYTPATTYIGTGALGGIMPDYLAMGRWAGALVKQQLQGREPVAAGPENAAMAVQLDWRQVQRWGIDEKAIPHDAVLHFREPTLWQAHRTEASFAALVFLIQAALIAALVFERRRRRLAEQAANRQRAAFAHASRLAIAGELTASIAHEINQPLGAILANADTAELLLESNADKRGDLRRIVADIRRDDLRASDIIRRLRALLSKQQAEHQAFDLNDAVRDMELLIRPEAARRGMALELRLAPSALTLVGDRIQIQQLLINLVLNAIDAMAAMSEPRRTVEVATQSGAGRIGITVRDRGPGISAEDLPKIFDSFFSTKRTGMGLGLSIARNVVEAHGGRIRAEGGAGEGAVFQIDLPAAASADVAASRIR